MKERQNNYIETDDRYIHGLCFYLHHFLDNLTSPQVKQIIDMLGKNYESFTRMPDARWRTEVVRTLSEHINRGDRTSFGQ